MQYSLTYLFVGLTIGIIIGNYYDAPLSVLAVNAIFFIILLFISVKKKMLRLTIFFILPIVVIIGIFNVQKQQYFPHNKNDDISLYSNTGMKTVEGIITESPYTYPQKNVLIVRCLRIFHDDKYIPVSGNVRLTIPSDLSYSYGDLIRFHSSLKKISNFQNPGGFKVEQYFRRQGIQASGFVDKESKIVLLRENVSGGAKRQLELFRSYLKKIVYENTDSPAKEIITAMTIGDKHAISQDVRSIFSKTGTSHLLAISGFHVGIVAASAFFLISSLLKTSEYLMLRFNTLKLAATGSLLFVVIYALIAGLGVTVTRATIMAAFFLIALVSGKQKNLYNILVLAGLIILIVSPESLFNISFQLSFIAVLFIIYMMPKFPKLSFEPSSRAPAWLISVIYYFYNLILVCVAATIGTAPLILYYFNIFSPITILANLIAVPLLGTVSLTLSMFFVLCAFFSASLAGLFVKLAALFVHLSVDLIGKIASLSWSSFDFAKPNILEIIIFYLLIFISFELLALRRQTSDSQKGFFYNHQSALKFSLFFLIIILAVDITYMSLKDRLTNNLRITAIDVGQGSSTLLRYPKGKTMLIDGGGSIDSAFDTGKFIIAPFLYHERISKIDIVVLTHPHPDHLQGLLHIIEKFHVQEVWCTNMRSVDEIFLKWEKIISQKNLKITYLSSGLTLSHFSGVEMSVYWPLENHAVRAENITHNDINDSSLVMKIKYGNISFLITGDITERAELSIIKSGLDLKSDVLFVPHHGSSTSSSDDFIKLVAGKFAIISAGRNNIFRHPHPQVLKKYESSGAKIYRTDLDGAVTLTTDGKSITTDTFVQKPIIHRR